MRIKKGDIVAIIKGRDRVAGDKPKTGKVLAVFPHTNRLIVEGVHMISRHTRPTQKTPQGGIVKKETSIHRSNVAIYCKTCSAPTKIAYKVLGDDAGKEKKQRICRKCGEAL